MKKQRRYRSWITKDGLMPFRVKVKETDLYILTQDTVEKEAKEATIRFRQHIEEYINQNPLFKESLLPLPVDPYAPDIVREMLAASQQVSVGPMAGVAGAIAEFVGKALLTLTPEVVVENGGDIFLRVKKERKIALFAGRSPLNMKIGIRVLPERTPLGVCTSSGTVGHSRSFGKADAVCVIAPSATLADATATFLGNMVQDKRDIERALEEGGKIPGVDGIVIVLDDALGARGDLELLSL